MSDHKYLAIITTPAQGDIEINPRRVALNFMPGLTGYTIHDKQTLENGSVMTIFKVRYVFADIPYSLKALIDQFKVQYALVFDPSTKFIQNSMITNWDDLRDIIKRIRMDPSLI